jgi:methylmalonyl-CoA epimerase
MDALAVGLPDYFGRNWDALDEVLAHSERENQGPILIVWDRPHVLETADSAAGQMFRRIVHDAAQTRHERGYGSLVLLASGAKGLPVTPASRVHHVATVVRDLDAALGFYRDRLGLPVELVLQIPSDGVRIAFLPVGESKIELVEPTDPSTGVARFLESRGEGFHHVCLEVADIATELNRLAAEGVELIDEAPRPGAEGPVAFIHPRSCHGVLVELIEAPGGPAWTELGIRPLSEHAGQV